MSGEPPGRRPLLPPIFIGDFADPARAKRTARNPAPDDAQAIEMGLAKSSRKSLDDIDALLRLM
jgi:hypothetical protein